jgi:hypothetical protein
MKKYALIVGLMLLFLSPVTRAEAADRQNAGVLPSGQPELQDRSTEDACDCCQKCTAARKTIIPHQEEGTAEKNGCEDCCDRCGRPMPPAPESIPPEVIKKDKPKR